MKQSTKSILIVDLNYLQKCVADYHLNASLGVSGILRNIEKHVLKQEQSAEYLGKFLIYSEDCKNIEQNLKLKLWSGFIICENEYYCAKCNKGFAKVRPELSTEIVIQLSEGIISSSFLNANKLESCAIILIGPESVYSSLLELSKILGAKITVVGIGDEKHSFGGFFDIKRIMGEDKIASGYEICIQNISNKVDKQSFNEFLEPIGSKEKVIRWYADEKTGGWTVKVLFKEGDSALQFLESVFSIIRK